MLHNDVVIVGGGPIGLSMAILLAKQDKRVVVLNRSNTYSGDGRILAMSYASYLFLDSIDSWDMEVVTSIKQVHMSHSGFGISTIRATDLNLPQLGFTVKYTDLCDRLYKSATSNPNIRLIEANVLDVKSLSEYTYIEYESDGVLTGITCDLAIIAEGGKLKISNVQYTTYDYNKYAIIAKLNMHDKCQHDIAYERFDDEGSMVFLPYGNDYVLVWAVLNKNIHDYTTKDYIDMKLRDLSFINRFAGFELDNQIHSFPLKLQVAQKRTFNRVVLIGNSSQIIHPISAQGLNLGFRDCMDLDAVIKRFNNYHDVVGQYDSYRLNDAKRVVNFTHFLARFIDNPKIRHVRGLGIIGLSNCQKLQNYVAKSLIFGA